MVHAGFEGGESPCVAVRATGRGRTEHTKAGRRSTGSSRPGRIGNQHGVTTQLRKGTKGLMGDGDDRVAGVVED